jgi:hypothetical protein
MITILYLNTKVTYNLHLNPKTLFSDLHTNSKSDKDANTH